MSKPDSLRFEDFSLPSEILKAIQDIGFETPSPIQEKTIPLLLDGDDVLGIAQTGTGKTAAFGLPLIARIDPKLNHPQMLVLAPTRELANQVAEALQSFSRNIAGLKVLPIYGGQDYGQQLRALKRGAHVIVGTPGRVIDHLDRGTLKIENLKSLVLDEADEMLRMGFIDDVERIMKDTPASRQTALFSATMPAQIQKLTKRYMNSPKEVKIESKTQTVSNISQHFWQVTRLGKMEALARLLEMQEGSATIVFARTKTATTEVAERLEARGFKVAALNGDMNQTMRERTIERLKSGSVDVVIATDVAARGLDVERIGLVVNFDIPYDSEAYVHRIGRTGRAGRSGKAVLFVGGREQRLLYTIERATKQKIEKLELPTTEQIEAMRLQRFEEELKTLAQGDDLAVYRTISEKLAADLEMDAFQLASLLLMKGQSKRPLIMPNDPPERLGSGNSSSQGDRPSRDRQSRGRDGGRDGGRFEGGRQRRESGGRDGGERRPRRENSGEARAPRRDPNMEMEVYRIDAGREHGIQARHIVGAIANEAKISSQNIGHVKLFDDYSTVELPVGMPEGVQKHLNRSFICSRPMRMTKFDS
ncbi:DEAD/DEAH box helicase [Alginatibacterium sediminis]|uniref:ATP-dependent RNA helicase DeaD n=1 Tax=Alginatibacterium sediminis TaxID=2164068 RepID=A0A420EHS3_9ALTE|nr:DEAD/DEAH box helicase [Alginatibacterium sediminis]RKF20207.1 DEAD/DEAH box helicase [Alginatibacterium sediminis]